MDTIELTGRALEIAERTRARDHEQKIAKAQPLNDRVLIRRIEEETDKLVQTADAWRPKSNMGEVLAVGHRVTSLKKGDRVLFGYYSAQDIELDAEELVLISAYDVWLRL